MVNTRKPQNINSTQDNNTYLKILPYTKEPNGNQLLDKKLVEEPEKANQQNSVVSNSKKLYKGK